MTWPPCFAGWCAPTTRRSMCASSAEVPPEALPALLAGYDFVLDDHSAMPTAAMARCAGLRHIIFLGTGARSYMHPEELAALGITVHIIRGYGDTAVAEHAIALMLAAARGIARMDRDMRAGRVDADRGPAVDRQDPGPARLRGHRRRGRAHRWWDGHAGAGVESHTALRARGGVRGSARCC